MNENMTTQEFVAMAEAMAARENKVKKVTKRDQYATLSALVMSHPDISAEEKDRLTTFIAHEVELLDKKSAKSGNSKKAQENSPIKAAILEKLAENTEGMTITALQAKYPDLFYRDGEISNQRISSLMKQLINSKQVVKTINKKKAYFSLATVETAED